MEDLMDFDDLIEDLIEDEQKNIVDSEEEETEDKPEEKPASTEVDDEPEEEEEEAPLTKEEKPTSEDEDDAPIEGYYNFLKEYGVLDVPEDFKFDGTAESLEEALQTTKKNLAAKVSQAIWEHLPDDFKPLLEYGLNGGTSLQEYLKAYSTQVDLESVDLTDEDNQKAIIREYYRQTTKMNDEQINRMLNRLETMGGLDEEAEDAVNYLKEFKETAKERLLQKAQEEQEALRLKAQQEIETLKASIQKASLDETRKRRVEAFMLAPIKEGKQVTTSFDKALNDILSNPEHLVQLADILADYHPSKGIDLNRIETKIKTQNNKTFKQLLNESVNNSKPTGNSTKRKVKEDFDWDGFLNS